MLQINRNTQYTQNKALPRVLAEDDSLSKFAHFKRNFSTVDTRPQQRLRTGQQSIPPISMALHGDINMYV